MDSRRRQIERLGMKLDSIDVRFGVRREKLDAQHKAARQATARSLRRLVSDIRHEQLAEIIESSLRELSSRLKNGLDVFWPAADPETPEVDLPVVGLSLAKVRTQLWASSPGSLGNEYIIYFLWSADRRSGIDDYSRKIPPSVQQGLPFLKLRFDRQCAPPAPRSIAKVIDDLLDSDVHWPGRGAIDRTIEYDPDQDIIEYWMKPEMWYSRWLSSHLRHWGSSEMNPHHPSKERMSAYWVEPMRNWRIDLVELQVKQVHNGSLVFDQLWRMPFDIGPTHVDKLMLGELVDPPLDRHSSQWADQMLQACLSSSPW